MIQEIEKDNELGKKCFFIEDNWEKESKITQIINDIDDSLDIMSDELDDENLTSPVHRGKKNKLVPPKLLIKDINEHNTNNSKENLGCSAKQVPKLNFDKVKEKYQLPDNDVKGLYKYEEKPINKTYAVDDNVRLNLYISQNYDKLKIEVKKTRRAIKDYKSQNKNNNEYYLRIVSQLNNLKDNISKTDKKIANIEKEFRNIGGIKPEFVSTISISELNVIINLNSERLEYK